MRLRPALWFFLFLLVCAVGARLDRHLPPPKEFFETLFLVDTRGENR